MRATCAHVTRWSLTDWVAASAALGNESGQATFGGTGLSRQLLASVFVETISVNRIVRHHRHHRNHRKSRTVAGGIAREGAGFDSRFSARFPKFVLTVNL
jgi:hypothetical protein